MMNDSGIYLIHTIPFVPAMALTYFGSCDHVLEIKLDKSDAAFHFGGRTSGKVGVEKM